MDGQLMLRADEAAADLSSAEEALTVIRDMTELIIEACEGLSGSFEGEAAGAFYSETAARVGELRDSVNRLAHLTALIAEAAQKIAKAKKKAAFLSEHIGRAPG